MIKINNDITQRVVVDSSNLPWVDSNVSCMQSKMLEHRADEFARTTSIVRYEANADLGSHIYPSGQELLVLEGDYEDEEGIYGAGTYIKNPPESSYTIRSKSGCTLFVKNNYLPSDDNQRTILETQSVQWFQGLVRGLTVLPLAEFGTKHTALVRWAPKTRFNPHRHYGGEEILVMEGVFEDEFGKYPAGTWIRSPHMSGHHPFSIQGCLILVMTGHLLD